MDIPKVAVRRACAPVRLHCHALLAMLAIALYPSPGSAALRISEVLCAPTVDYDNDGEIDTKSDEWVEIVNWSASTVELDHWYLRDATGDDYHYGFSGTLEAGGVLVVTGTMAQVWQAANTGSNTGLSLNNTGEIVDLWYDAPDADPLLMDQMTVPPHAAAAGRSFVLDPANGLLYLHDGLSPYGGTALPPGTGCMPNPGTSGTCFGEVPNETVGWGALKAEFAN